MVVAAAPKAGGKRKERSEGMGQLAYVQLYNASPILHTEVGRSGENYIVGAFLHSSVMYESREFSPSAGKSKEYASRPHLNSLRRLNARVWFCLR